MSVNGNLALITGSSIRIGRFIAEKLARDGWRIAAHYHNSYEEAVALKKDLSVYTQVSIFKADLGQVDQAMNMLEEIEEQMGDVDLLVNNASIYKNDNLFELSNESILENYNIHVFSPLQLGRKIKIGNIINILDAELTHQLKKFFSYSLSKKSVFELTKMMAYNMAPSVRVNSIALGPVLFKEGQVKKVFDDLIRNSPLQVQVTLEEIYQTMQFILKTKSITGQCIFLDGGIHLQ